MRRIYQTEWQNIPFSSFTSPSSKKLAGADFYEAFYVKFFKRYQRWDQLPSKWRQTKRTWADFIATRARNRSRVLSVGCGLGIVERHLSAQNTQIDLTIHEVAPSSWRWVEHEFASDRKLTGTIPECLPDDVRFDLVYLGTVDYALDDDKLINLLSVLRGYIAQPNGECLLISASFERTPETLSEIARFRLGHLKEFAKDVLGKFGLYSRGQFWGWTRSRAEYQSLMRRAGYRDIEDGFIDSEAREHYWIAGH
ncbi:MAG: class I SAM-dependent methyltransferase [Gemmatimonadota bacterium]|nr:class I SAM-dependent methyltransferase [Gemmatimonadota bacterium]